MSKSINTTRATCAKCGKKRFKRYMKLYGIQNNRTKRFTWVCEPFCEASFFKGQPTKATNILLTIN